MRLKSRLGNLLCFFRCHLLGGDVCGYVWGKTNLRIEVPIRNEKRSPNLLRRWTRRQKRFIVQEYSAGNGENTVVSLNIFKSNVRSPARVDLGWSSYHKSEEMKAFWRMSMRARCNGRSGASCLRTPEQTGRRCMVTNQNSSENTGCCVNRSL